MSNTAWTKNTQKIIRWAAAVRSNGSPVQVIQPPTYTLVTRRRNGSNRQNEQPSALRCVRCCRRCLWTVNSHLHNSVGVFFFSCQSQHKAPHRCHPSLLHPHPIPSPTRHEINCLCIEAQIHRWIKKEEDIMAEISLPGSAA